MQLTPDELTVAVESLRFYRLRSDIQRKGVIDPLILKLVAQLAKPE